VNPNEDSIFGYGSFVGFLALAIWSIATSIARYRAVAAEDVRPLPKEKQAPSVGLVRRSRNGSGQDRYVGGNEGGRRQ
jgi:hypothetical protein